MIGFTALYAAGELQPDPAEVAAAGWFAVHDLPRIPPPFTIAHCLIESVVADARR